MKIEGIQVARYGDVVELKIRLGSSAEAEDIEKHIYKSARQGFIELRHDGYTTQFTCGSLLSGD